jgi:polar amino acid transport system permease protein/polar amino acid transport system substrate-binding protein
LEALKLWFIETFTELKRVFILCFIDDNRWEWLRDGFVNSIIITFFAIIIGLFFGIVLAAIRSSYDKNEESLKLKGGIGYYALKFFNAIAKLYITVIRGIPVVVQLLIWYFVILVSQDNDIVIAIIAFGFNSAAYVAEIFRGGIMSIDNGQFEAGRSLGFNYVQTMIYIILPQALKNVLPTLANEFIVLLKETSVASFIAVKDMMKGANALVGFTYNMNIPYLTVALIYLVLVLILQKGVSILERRLRNSDH